MKTRHIMACVHTMSANTCNHANSKYMTDAQHRKNEGTITKRCLYNFEPLKPHFYIVKLGFTGVYIIFYFCSKTQIVGTH